jgi:hypothetical protein
MTFRAAKQWFFDRAKVKNAVDVGTRRVLSRFGAFVRTRAKTSIRKKERGHRTDPGTVDLDDNKKLSQLAWIKVTLNGEVVYKSELKVGDVNLTGSGGRALDNWISIDSQRLRVDLS